MKTPEIMAPVGSFESLQAAIKAGADSVYLGVKQLNMRVRAAHNFTLEELKEVAQTCHKNNVKAYITLNTLLYQHDLALMRKIIDSAKEAKIDAIICQDQAAIQYASSIGMGLHASTQLSISNIETVKFYAQFVDTIVLARELDMKMITEICTQVKEQNITGPAGNLVKIEIFVHGALCIAQSGRCQMSLMQTNTSAQRGACLHECRKEYLITDLENGQEFRLDNAFIMSPKDLCALPFLDKVVETGAAVFKIEGRARKADYVFRVVKAYREAVDAIADNTFTQEKINTWMESFKTVYNRGFCDGYYLGKPLPEWSQHKGNKATHERIHVGIIEHYYPKANIAEIKVQANEVSLNDKFVITGKTTGVIFGEVTDMMIDEKHVEKSGKPSLITIPIKEKVRKNDQIFILKENENI